ncbi:MAG: glycosyltransferase family 39 protein [Acidobacteriota bacterium]
MRSGELILLLIAALLFAGYVMVTPVGEAPDEAAHVLYLDYLIQNGALPPLPEGGNPSSYEAHQPPLAYLYSMAILRAAGVEALAYPFVSNPGLDFFTPGSRAYLPPQDRSLASREGRKVRGARWTNLLWLLLTVWALLRAAQIAGRGAGSLVAASAFALAPQFLFISASVNNDAAVTAWSSLAFWNLFKLVRQNGQDDPSVWPAWLGGLFAGLALWSKTSGLFLLAPAALAAFILVRRREFSRIFFLWFPLLMLGGLWLFLNLMRFGSWWPPPPTGFSASIEQGVLRVLTEPGWIASLGISFWAKFGWLNTPLPLLLYALFAPVSLLVVWGSLNAFRRQPSAMLARLALTGLAANLALLLLYMVFIDWQPQGRYLFPSLVPFAVLAAAGWQDASARIKAFAAISERSLAWVGLTAVTLAALAGLLRITFSYS